MEHPDLAVEGALQVSSLGSGDNAVLQDETVHRVLVLGNVRPRQRRMNTGLLRTYLSIALPARDEGLQLASGGDEHAWEPMAGQGLDVLRDHDHQSGGQAGEGAGVIEREADLLTLEELVRQGHPLGRVHVHLNPVIPVQPLQLPKGSHAVTGRFVGLLFYDEERAPSVCEHDPCLPRDPVESVLLSAPPTSSRGHAVTHSRGHCTLSNDHP